MKKRTFILTFFMMFCSLAFGQNTGWGNVNPYDYEKSMTVVSFINVNESTQSGSNFEVGAFCGDEMRGKASIKEVVDNNNTQHHLAYITIYGNADGETISFKLYNNETQKVIYPSAYKVYPQGQAQSTEVGTIAFVANGVFGTTAKPYTIRFDDAAKIGSTKYATLAEAFAAATEGQTVEMLRNVTEDFAINNEANVTFNMAGYTLTGAILPSTANLTVKNGTIVNNNTSCSAIEITSGSIVLNEDVKVSSVRHAIRIDGAVAATIKGGEYTLIPKSGRTHHALNVSGAANVTIEGGKFVGPKGTASDSGSAVNVQSGATVTIIGGEFSGGKRNTLASSGTAALLLKGGKYHQGYPEQGDQFKQYCAEGYMTVKDGDWYEVIEAAAKIVETGVIYSSFDEAYTAAKTGQTIKLFRTAVITNFKPWINYSKKNITVKAEFGETAFRVQDGAYVWFGGMTIESDDYCITVGAADGTSGATVEFYGGTYYGETTAVSVTKGDVKIMGGTFKVEPYQGSYEYTINCIDANYNNKTAKVSIQGGKFYNFNPQNNAAEGAGTNFLVAGYAAAQDAEGWYTVVKAVAKVGTTYYATLPAAVEAAQAGQTVTLLQNVELAAILTIDKAITLDGNNKTLTSTAGRAINVDCDGTVNIQNLTIAGSTGCERGINIINQAGTTNLSSVKVYNVSYYAVHVATSAGAAKVNVKDSDLNAWAAIAVYGEGTNVYVENSTLVGTNTYTGESDDFATVAFGSNATINVVGGTITAKSSEGKASQSIVCAQENVEGGNVTLNSTFVLEGTATYVNMNVTDNALYVNAEYADELQAEGWATVEAGNGLVKVRKAPAGHVAYRADVTDKADREGIAILLKEVFALESVVVKVYNGETLMFTSTRRDIDDEGKVMFPVDGNTTANIVLWGKESGSWINEIHVAPTELNVPNMIKVYSDGVLVDTYTHESGTVLGTNLEKYLALDCVKKAVAQVGETKYMTLAEAVEACPNEGTVTVLRDATGAGVVINKDVTIDFNGKTYTANEGVGSTGTQTLGFQILKNKNVTLMNGTFTSEGANIKMLVQNYANLTLNNMNLVDNTDHIQYALSNNSGNVNIIGNTNITTDAVAFDVFDYTSAGYEVPVVAIETTGTIYGNIEVSAGLENNLTIKGGYFTYDVTDYCADGYICSYANGLYNVTASAVAKIDDTTYPTLAAAVEAAQNGDVITILRNTIGAGVVIDKSVTIDFAKNLYSFKSGVGSATTETNGFQILAGNTVTLKNGALEVAPKFRKNFYILVQNYANLNVVDMKLDGANLDKYSATDGDSYVLSNNSGTVNITGNTAINANDEGALAFAFDVCKYQNYAAPVVNVNTTDIICGKIEVSSEINSNLNISGGYFTVEIQEAWCADGYIPTTVDLNGTTYYTVEEGNFVARNTTTGQKYATLQAAVDAANAGDTIELLKDITLEGGYANDAEAGLGIELPGNVGDTSNEKGLTIDGKGFTIDCGSFTKGIRIYNYISGRPSIVTFNDITIVNNNTDGRCIDTRSGNINLKINNTDLIATKGNSQPLTIGGTEKIHRVSLGNNTTIDAGNSGYGVICFVSTNVDVITSGSTKINGYAAFYVKGDAIDVQLDLGQGVYTGKNIHSGESNAFGTVVLEGDNTVVKLIGTNPTINAIAEGTATQAAFLVLGENNTINIESTSAIIETTGVNAYWAMIDAEVASTTTIVDNYTYLYPAAEADGFQFMTLEEAVRYAKDAVKVVNANTVANPIIVEKDLTLNLNGKAITATENVYPVIRVQGGANVTVTGEGSITNATDYVFVLGSSDKATAGNLTIEGGSFVASTTVASVTKGNLTINGGDFSLVEGTTDYRYLINCIDANYNNGSAKVAIYGGTFHNWNPEDNAAEGANTNFCAPGYTALETSENVWTVVTGLRKTLAEGWNWFSSYIDIDGTTGFGKLKSALGTSGLQIKGQLGFVDYSTGWGWNGSLESTSVKEMYMIQTSAQVELVLEGNIVNPAETEITLQKNWTYIGYPVTEPMNTKDALAGIQPKEGDIIKTHNGAAQYYEDLNGWSGWWGEELQSMTPGMGYMYKNTSGVTKTLVYPTPNANSRAAVKANVTAENNHWAPNASAFANNMNIIAVLENNDMMGEFEVAAFVNGEVRGSARPTYVEPIDAYVLLMTIYGEEGEELTFKYYDIYSDEEHSINNTVTYSDDAVIGSIREPYMFFANTLGMDENAASTLSIYPNPTTTNTAISFETTFDMVEVFNSLGAKVAEYRNVDRIEGMEAAGVYVIRVTNDSAVQNCRLIVK